MKRKFIRREEWMGNILPEEKLTFFDSSPVAAISLPPKTVALAFHGNWTAHDIQGTFYVLRHDSSDTVLLNIDAYSFRGRLDEEKMEIVGPRKTEHHHVDDIPLFIKIQTPRRLIDRAEEIRQGRSSNSNFIKS